METEVAVEVEEIIHAAPDKVWEMAADFGALNTFVEAIQTCEIEDTGNGPVRILTLQDGATVKEKLISLDDKLRKLTYNILESPMPIENYVGTMMVKEADEEDASVFHWSSTFKTSKEAEGDMKKALADLYALGAEGLRKKFE